MLYMLYIVLFTNLLFWPNNSCCIQCFHVVCAIALSHFIRSRYYIFSYAVSFVNGSAVVKVIYTIIVIVAENNS